MTVRALVIGVSGQDGAYLARHLLEQGCTVIGTSRDAELSSFANLRRLGVRERVTCLSMTTTDFRSVLGAMEKADADLIFNLAGQTSVGLSFDQPVETLESITTGTLNALEAIRFRRRECRFYNASSSEIFGDVAGGEPADETTAFRPRSPYGVAKAAAHWLVANYREAYGLHASSGILFNHESPLRPARFVTAKIVNAAVRIAGGSGERLSLGRLDVVRDWGWAPEYVEAMAAMTQRDEPEDYVIATGRSVSLETFVALVFAALDLDWRDHVDSDPGLYRATDIAISRADPGRAERRLGWRARTDVEGVARRLVEAARAG